MLTTVVAALCYTLFSSSEAVIACQKLEAQAEVFTLQDFSKDTDHLPHYVRVLTKPDIDGRGERLEPTAWGQTPDEAVILALDILEKMRAGEW